MTSAISMLIACLTRCRALDCGVSTRRLMPAFEGKVFKPGEKVRWKTNEIGMQRLGYANRLSASENNQVALVGQFGSICEVATWSSVLLPTNTRERSRRAAPP